MEGSKAGRIDGKLEGPILLFQLVDFGSNRVELVLQLILPTLRFPQVSGHTHKKHKNVSCLSIYHEECVCVYH